MFIFFLPLLSSYQKSTHRKSIILSRHICLSKRNTMKTVSAVSKAYIFQSLNKWLVWFMGDYHLFQQFFQSYCDYGEETRTVVRPGP